MVACTVGNVLVNLIRSPAGHRRPTVCQQCPLETMCQWRVTRCVLRAQHAM